MSCTIPHEVWYERIQASRERREKFEHAWAAYARLHTNAYLAVRDKNDYQVTLPNGDQVKLGLVYSNIEQTLALLEVPEIGVRATATDYTQELGEEETHREAVVEQGVYQSMTRSGLIKGTEEVDYIKRDAIMIGHGVNYTFWRVEEAEVKLEPVMLAVMDPATGAIVPEVDPDTGAPKLEQRTERQVWWEAAQDEHISPLEFLFDASAKRIEKSDWHGYERPVALSELRRDSRLSIPDHIKGLTIARRDLYGQDGVNEEEIEDAVVVIKIWDRANKELITFIEHQANPASAPKQGKKRKTKNTGARDLSLALLERWPVQFEHPDDSPFTVFVPIPANDHPFGISQIEHIRVPAVEADKLRTRMANLTRQVKVLLLYQKGRIDQGQLEAAMRSPEAAAVGVDLQDGDTFDKLFKEVQPAKVPPEIYEQIVQAKDDIRNVSGVSEMPFGGAETATESENQMVIGGARPKRKRRRYMSFLTEIARRHKDFLRAFAPEGQTIPVQTWDGRPLNLTYGREAFEGRFEIEVLPAGGAMAVSPVKQKLMVEMSDRIVGKINPMVDLIWLRQTLTQLDVRDVNAIMRAARMGAGVPPGLPAPGAGTPPGINLNNVSNGQTIRAAINAPSEGRI